MAHYGELLDTSYDPSKNTIYETFVKYFGDLNMTKIKDVDTYSMYVAKIQCMLGREYRYVMVFIDKDNVAMKNESRLSDLRWVSLQTRTMLYNHNIQSQKYTPRRMPELMKRITLVTKTGTSYVYHSEEFPLEVTLLSKKKDEMEYQPTGNVITALETYNTIINWI